MTKPEMKSIHHMTTIVLVAMLLLAVGCKADLKPAMTADQVIGLEDAATTRSKGVTLQVQAGQWPGPGNIKYEVTPLRIRIQNNSGKPLRVRYNEFTLTASDGSSYSALPLIKIAENVMVAPEDFYHDKFTIAPYCSRHYPDIEPFTKRTLPEEMFRAVKQRTSEITTGFLAPIFFASIGLHLDLAVFSNVPLFLAILIAVASSCRLIGAALPAYWVGLPARQSLVVGIGMSGRGAVELIIAVIALWAGLFSQPTPTPAIVANLFSSIVIMAVVTTLVTPIGLRLVLDRDE